MTEMTLNYAWADEDHSILCATIDGKHVCIPAEPSNTDYQTFLKWCEEGNTPEPYVAPTVIDGITDLSQAKKVASDSVRSTAYSLLLPTDWVVTREMETGVAAPAEITAYRAAVRAASADKISAIESKGKLSTLATYLRSAEFAAWPEAPAS